MIVSGDVGTTFRSTFRAALVLWLALIVISAPTNIQSETCSKSEVCGSDFSTPTVTAGEHIQNKGPPSIAETFATPSAGAAFYQRSLAAARREAVEAGKAPPAAISETGMEYHWQRIHTQPTPASEVDRSIERVERSTPPTHGAKPAVSVMQSTQTSAGHATSGQRSVAQLLMRLVAQDAPLNVGPGSFFAEQPTLILCLSICGAMLTGVLILWLSSSDYEGEHRGDDAAQKRTDDAGPQMVGFQLRVPNMWRAYRSAHPTSSHGIGTPHGQGGGGMQHFCDQPSLPQLDMEQTPSSALPNSPSRKMATPEYTENPSPSSGGSAVPAVPDVVPHAGRLSARQVQRSVPISVPNMLRHSGHSSGSAHCLSVPVPSAPAAKAMRSPRAAQGAYAHSATASDFSEAERNPPAESPAQSAMHMQTSMVGKTEAQLTVLDTFSVQDYRVWGTGHADAVVSTEHSLTTETTREPPAPPAMSWSTLWEEDFKDGLGGDARYGGMSSAGGGAASGMTAHFQRCVAPKPR